MLRLEAFTACPINLQISGGRDGAGGAGARDADILALIAVCALRDPLERSFSSDCFDDLVRERFAGGLGRG